MATATRTDPYLGFKFRLEIQGIQVAGFSHATLPDETVDSVNYREGTDGPTRKLSGQATVGTSQARHHGFDGPLQLVEIGLGHGRRGRAQERISHSRR
jgi:hypothetical protein